MQISQLIMSYFSIAESDITSINDCVQQILLTAIEKKVSDIHFESHQHSMKIRFRIDGILYDACDFSSKIAGRIISHLKIRANMDIAEKRLPQDGRYVIIHNNVRIICRASSLPMLYGEKIVVRLLETQKNLLDIDLLGFTPEQKKIFVSILQKPQGLILITGPTGSGKTTTLYTAISILNTSEKNITTLEDPIEIELENINQLNINPKIGLDFQNALRALLRQDPDIIMIGEIRDSETAIMAIHAAQTGHLVLATLHTNNSVESLTRFAMMGIAPIDIAETLNLVIAQRLVRQLCIHCKTPTTFSEHALTQPNLTSKNLLFQATGCLHCINGFQGRTGIYEFFELSDNIKQKLLQGCPPSQLAKEANLATLWEMGLHKVMQGITNLSELYRAIGN